MVDFGLRLHTILTNTYSLFTLAMGLWAIYFVVRNRQLDGSFWGALTIQSLLAVGIFVVTVLLTLNGNGPVRWVYWLYAIYFMVVLPSTYALLRGRDDRLAAWVYIGVCLFTFLANASRSGLVFAVVNVPN